MRRPTPGSCRRPRRQRRSRGPRRPAPRVSAHSETSPARGISSAKTRVLEQLFAAPDRLALLGEGGRALTGVLGGEDRAGDLALLCPALFLGPVDRALDDLLGCDQRE